MTYKDNTPTFNGRDRKVVNFGDYCANFDKEKEEFKKVRRSILPNSERQQHPKNSKYKYNRITRKMDDLTPDIIDDQIENMESGE